MLSCSTSSYSKLNFLFFNFELASLSETWSEKIKVHPSN